MIVFEKSIDPDMTGFSGSNRVVEGGQLYLESFHTECKVGSQTDYQNLWCSRTPSVGHDAENRVGVLGSDNQHLRLTPLGKCPLFCAPKAVCPTSVRTGIALCYN